ncbi:MAG: DNA-directed RNA polymerase beta subunit [Candidatus Ozemobacter sibiricus]|jgi:hypothetical protein|uniref:DNA-directed RNA polymerase n=1 Tax=Candidatus Ozemobacter sibiricus TaxID=2268124 RepID=A0A367ZJB3_9BACT|nr:MAG: DNA-directed RNA polymerase beta subunit [Candidatus Ozemobacter sibiricus]
MSIATIDPTAFTSLIREEWASFLNTYCPPEFREGWDDQVTCECDAETGWATIRAEGRAANGGRQNERLLLVKLPWPREGGFAWRSPKTGGWLRLVPRLYLEPDPAVPGFQRQSDPYDLRWYRIVPLVSRLAGLFRRWLRAPLPRDPATGQVESPVSEDAWEKFLGHCTVPARDQSLRQRGKGLTPKTIPLRWLFRFCVLEDETNPLARATQRHSVLRQRVKDWDTKHERERYKVLHPRSAHYAARDVHPSFRGAICPIESPESTLVGLSVQKAAGAAIDPLTGRLTPAPFDDTAAFCSIGTLQVPFLSHNHSPRLMMGGKNLKQALPPIVPETPLVRTGWEERVPAILHEETGREPVVRAPRTGRIEKRADRLLLHPDDGSPPIAIPLWEAPAAPKPVASFGQPLVEDGNRVEQGEPVIVRAGLARGEDGVIRLALGRQLRVLYLPWYGWNFEDAVVAGPGAVERLTCRLVVPVSWTCGADRSRRGVLPVGTKVRGGQELLPGVPRSGVPFWIEEGVILDVAPPHDTGELVAMATADGRRDGVQPLWHHRVLIGVDQPLGVGDKVMGRYGNKGVISKILPEAELPEVILPDGRSWRPDLILNPMGLLSRKNPGQLFETQLGLLADLDRDAFAREFARAGEPFACLSRPDLAREIVDALEARGAPRGQVKVRFPDGHEVYALAGTQYMVRLDHLPQAKWAVRAAPVGQRSPLTGQPLPGIRQTGRKRGLDGGQRLGEMEMWALLAHGLDRNLDDILNVRSRPPGATGPAQTLAALHDLLRALGFGLDPEGLRLTLLPDPEPPSGPGGGQEAGRDAGHEQKADEGLIRIPNHIFEKHAVSPVVHPILGCRLNVVRQLPERFFSGDQARGRKRSSWLQKQYKELANLVDDEVLKKAGKAKPGRPAATAATAALAVLARRMQAQVERIFGCRLTLEGWPVGLARRRAGGPAAEEGPTEEAPAMAAGEWSQTLMGLLAPKMGLVRRHLLGRRLDRSGRAVIVPAPDLPPDRVRLPALARDLLSHGLPASQSTRRPWVLLNRNPTLHRYNILAARAVWGAAPVIGLPPLLCGMFGADFDGDTMAFHLPTSQEARQEAGQKASFGPHAFSVATGQLQAHLTQDLKLGLWLLAGPADRVPAGCEQARRDLEAVLSEAREMVGTAGEGPLAALLERPETLSQAIRQLSWALPGEPRARFLWRVSQAAFAAATRAGVSLSLADLLDLAMAEPTPAAVADADDGAAAASRGTPEEAMQASLKERAKVVRGNRPGFLDIPLSGARDPAFSDVRQLVAMAGTIDCWFSPLFAARLERADLFADLRFNLAPPPPVRGNFLRGFDLEEFWAGSRDGRRGMVEKKLGTPPAGYFTRLLVEAAFPWRVSDIEDCGTTRTMPRPGQRERVRSPLFCQLPESGRPWEVCRKCLGPDPSTGRPFQPGEWIGIIAAESVGERGTQEAMKKFHKGAGTTGAGGERLAATSAASPAGAAATGLVAWRKEGVRLTDAFRSGWKLEETEAILALIYDPQGPFAEAYKHVLPVHFEMLARTRRQGDQILPLVDQGLATGPAGGALAALGFERLPEVLQRLAVAPPPIIGSHPKTLLMLGRWANLPVTEGEKKDEGASA